MRIIDKLKKKDNTSLVIRNTLISIVVKGGSLFIALFTTPAYMHFFDNNEILGVWFTLLSVLAWILNCDMGIGNGLRNNLVYAINDKDWDKAKKYISSSYIFLTIVGSLIFLMVRFAGDFVSWNRVFNISTSVISSEIMAAAVQILLASIILQFILRLVTSVLYALQEAFVPGLMNLLTNSIMLIYVVTSNILGNNNNITNLATVYLFAVNLPLVIATFFVFVKKIPKAAPSISYFKMSYAIEILKIGAAFLWLQLIAMIIDNTNSYLIAVFVNNSAVVEYQIYSKIFNLPMTAVMLLTTSLWSTITKVKAENDWVWIKNCYKKSMKLIIVIAVMEFIAICPLQLFFDLWLGEKSIIVNYIYAAVFAVSGIVMSLRTVLASYSNGLCELRVQSIYMTLGAVMYIPLAYLLSYMVNSYIAIVVANIISMMPYCIAQMIWCNKKFIRLAH